MSLDVTSIGESKDSTQTASYQPAYSIDGPSRSYQSISITGVYSLNSENIKLLAVPIQHEAVQILSIPMEEYDVEQGIRGSILLRHHTAYKPHIVNCAISLNHTALVITSSTVGYLHYLNVWEVPQLLNSSGNFDLF